MPRLFITGANRGIGLALAARFLNDGWEVEATVRNPDAADALRAVDGRLTIHRLDIADHRAIADLAGLHTDPVDILVSNAALTGGPIGSFGGFDQARFLEACAINAGSFMALAQAFADRVAASERRLMFAMSSRLGANPFYGYAEYFASKSALNQLVMQAAVALKPRGIAVVAAHPGWVETEATAGQGQAPLSTADAARLLGDLMEGMTLDQTGRFFDPDGSELPLVTQQTEIKFYSKPRDAIR